MSKLDEIKSSESKSFRKLNPHIFGGGPLLDENHPYGHVNLGGEDDAEHDFIEALTSTKPKTKKRIRQSEKPELNVLETEWFKHIQHFGARPQAIKLKLARGVFYKPDFFSPRTMTAWEVKGLNGKNIDRGKLALKCAASAWPEIKFILVWKDEQGQWQEQHVLP